MRLLLLLLAMTAGFVITSCTKESADTKGTSESSSEKSPSEKSDSPASDPSKSSAKSDTPSGSGSKPSNPLASGKADPAGMFKAAQKAAKGDVGAIWNMLPGQYQGDVKRVIENIKTKADREMIDGAVGVASKLAQLLDEKSSMISSHPMIGPMVSQMAGIEPDQFGVYLKAGGNALKQLTSGQLKQIGSFDLEKFVSQDLSPVASRIAALAKVNPQAAEQMKTVEDMQIEVLENDGQTAKVKVTQGTNVETVDLVRVEDKFLPKELVEAWDTNVAEFEKEALQALSGDGAAQAKQGIMMVTMQLDQLNAAQTNEEFQAALAPLMGMLMGGGRR